MSVEMGFGEKSYRVYDFSDYSCAYTEGCYDDCDYDCAPVCHAFKLFEPPSVGSEFAFRDVTNRQAGTRWVMELLALVGAGINVFSEI